MKLYPSYITAKSLAKFIKSALKEDIGSGDYTSLASIPGDQKGDAKLIIKDSGILAGVEMALHIFYAVDSDLEVNILIKDGSKVNKNDIGFTVHGKVQSILAAERLVLNCMQRMSGIATYTRLYLDAIKHTNAKLLDTRKTTPNFRLAEKWAVAIGGGYNHRYGLFDMILLKDNHIDYAGGVKKAIQSAQQYLAKENLDLKIEVEVRDLKELEEALTMNGVSRIMLDNMSTADMRKAVKIVNGTVPLEASGGINLETIGAVADTGVDYISVGALTHSIKSLDISLKAYKKIN